MVQTRDERPRIAAVGFSVISDPADAMTDLVFVHGLQGHPQRTWTHVPGSNDAGKKRRLFSLRRDKDDPSTSTEPSVYWPYDLLAKHPDLSQTRILTYGYDSLVTKFFDANNKQNISMHGNDLMVALEQERKSSNASTRPLVFVAHSLGGILVKVALNNSYRTRQEKYQRLFESTKGVVFLGTPHGGSDIAGWGLTVSNLAKLALQDSNQRVIKGLSPNNELLHHLSEAFLQLVDRGNFGVHTFYETKPMTGVYGITGMVVPYESARIGDIKHEVLRGLNANHRDICRYAGAEDEMYRAVSGAIADYILEAAMSRMLTSPSLHMDSDKQPLPSRVNSEMTLDQIDNPRPDDKEEQAGVVNPLETAHEKFHTYGRSERSLLKAETESRRPTVNTASLLTQLDNDLEEYIGALNISQPLTKRRDSRRAASLSVPAEGSPGWLFESPEYKDWNSRGSTAVLWLGGKISSENTQVVGRLLQEVLDTNVRASAFHYFHSSSSASSERALPGAEVLDIARELICQIIADECHRILYAMDRYPLSIITKQSPYIINKQDWELRHLMTVLFYCLVAVPDSTTFLIVDGLDISTSNTQRFLGQLKGLIDSQGKEHPGVVLKVFFASATRSFPQPLSEAEKQVASIPYIEKDKEVQGKPDCLDSLLSTDFDARPRTILNADDFTFDWLWEDDTFRQWRTAETSRLLLIQGKPGSGKSTLAKRILKGVPLPKPRSVDSDTSSAHSISSVNTGNSLNSVEASDGSTAVPRSRAIGSMNTDSGASVTATESLGNPPDAEAGSIADSVPGRKLNSPTDQSPTGSTPVHTLVDDRPLAVSSSSTGLQSFTEDHPTVWSGTTEVLERQQSTDANTGLETQKYDHESPLSHEVLMGYFFYSFRGGKTEMSHQGMLRSVLYQLLDQDHSLYPLFQSHYRQLRKQGGDDFWELPVLLQILESLGTIDKELTVYIVLDAMDESDDEKLPQILQAMAELCSTKGRSVFKGLMTTRPLKAKVFGQRIKQLMPLVLALEEKNQQAISRIVDKEIQQVIDDVLEEDESIDLTVFDEIKQYIKSHADGVFLWVSMVLKEVKSLSDEGWTQKNMEDLKTILPPELGDVYKRMTKRIAENAGPQALEQGKKILRSAVFSMRRLTIDETRDAMIVPNSFEVPQFEPNPAYFKSRIQLLQRRIPMVCGDLVEVKPPFVQLIHETVREFLLDPARIAAPLDMDDQMGRDEQSTICVRYLKLSLSRSILEHVGVRVSDVSSWRDDDYEAFVRLLDDRPFLDYCLSHLPQHLHTAKTDSIRVELSALIEEATDVAPILYLLMSTNIMPDVLVTRFESQANSARTFRTKALLVAVRKGYVRSIRPLVTAGANINQLEPSKGTFPLMEATVAGQERVVQLLLDLNVDLDTRDRSGETALHVAARLGRAAIAELLVEHGAFATVPNIVNETPLHLAVRFSRLDVVRVLVRQKLRQIDEIDIYGAAPLHEAAAHGQLDIAGLLLGLEAYVDADAKYIGTPLNVAVDKKDINMAQLLLDHGAEINRVGEYGATPLHTVASEGHEPIVRLLLDKGADPVVRDRYGWLPVDWARENGHDNIVNMLAQEVAQDAVDTDDKQTTSSVDPTPGTRRLFLSTPVSPTGCLPGHTTPSLS